MSTRRNASLVIALGVAALAATSLAAMVATSELLTESFGRPVSDRLEPSAAPDLGRPDVIQVEPPERSRGRVPAGRSRQPAAAPPPRRGPAPGPQAGDPTGPAAGGSVVVTVQRRPARQEPVVVLPVLAEPAAPPAPRPVRPSRPRPAWPPRAGHDGRRSWHHRHDQRGDRDRPNGDRVHHRRGDERRWRPEWDRDPGRHHHRHCHRRHPDPRVARRR